MIKNMQPSTPKSVYTTEKVTVKATTFGTQRKYDGGETMYPKKDNGSRPNTKEEEVKLTHNKDDHSA